MKTETALRRQNYPRRSLSRGLKAQPRPSGFPLQRSLLSAKAATGERLARNKDGTSII